MAINNFVPEIWAAALMEAYHAAAVVTPTVTHEYEGEAARGNTVHITSITTPTIIDYKGAGRVLTPQDLSDTDTDLNIDQEKAFGFYVDDIDKTQAAGSFAPVTADAGQALVEDAESYLLSLMVADGTDASGGATPFATADDAFDAVRDVRTALGKAKVPATNRFAVANPDFIALLLDAASKLTSVADAGDSGELRNGVVGRLLGFTVLESPLLNPSTPTVVGYQGQGAAFVTQMDQTEALRAPDKFADVMRGLHVYGGKIIRPTSVQVSTGKA